MAQSNDFWSYMGAPIVSGASSIFGGLLSGIFGSGASKRQIEAAKEMNRENIRLGRETNAQQLDMFNRSLDFNAGQSDLSWQRQKEMFDMENLYNSPLEIVKRLNEAGINPQVAFNGMTGFATSADGATPSGGASAPGIPSLTPPQYKFMPDYQSFNPFEAIANGITKFAVAAKGIADAKKAGVDTKKAESTLQSSIDAETARNTIDVINADLIKKYGYELKEKEVRKLDKEIDNIALTGDVLQAEYRLKHLEADVKDFESHFLEEKYLRVKEYIDNELESQKADILKKIAEANAIPKQVQAQLVSAFASATSAKAAMLNAQTQKWIAENPNDAVSFIIRGLAMNGLDAKQIVGWIGQKLGFLKGSDNVNESKVDKILNTEGLWKASPVMYVGKNVYDIYNELFGKE